MARHRDPPPPKPPTISKEDGRLRLATLRDRGRKLLENRPLREGQEDVWSTACLETIEATFGEASNHYTTFIGPIRVTFSQGNDRYDHYAEQRDADAITRRCGILETLIEQIDLEIGFTSPSPSLDFWNEIHPMVRQVAKQRFDNGHFADAVEAALKEVNCAIKDHVKRKTGEELDGAPLMQRAFSLKVPLIVLADLSTETGKSIQLGYLQLYSGAMTGIRNPKAHSNISIDDKRARHFIYLASLLAQVFDERL
jgi:uncharacterized protein (TIGR02391 family)